MTRWVRSVVTARDRWAVTVPGAIPRAFANLMRAALMGARSLIRASVAVLVLAGLFGIAFWPVVLAHAGLAVWCIAGLSMPALEEKRS